MAQQTVYGVVNKDRRKAEVAMPSIQRRPNSCVDLESEFC